MLRAFDGPVPMLTMVMPLPSGSTRWKAGIWGTRCAGAATATALPRRALGVTTLPGSTKASPDRIARRHALATHERKGVDVELIVREDDEVLEVFRIGAGVMVEPVQRVVDPGSPEQSQRLGCPGLPAHRAVDDGVVHRAQIRGIEKVAQRLLANRKARREINAPAIGEMDGNWLFRLPDLNRHAVVLDQEPDLLRQIAAEEVGPRHRRLVHARTGHEAVGQPRIDA